MEETIREFMATFSSKKKGLVSEEKSLPEEEEKSKSEEKDDSDDDDDEEEPKSTTTKSPRRGPDVLFSVDARKLGSAVGGGKVVRSGFPRRYPRRAAWEKHIPNQTTGGPWDVICFNFPHVGGLSTDVNRQVRANQELLVAFFKSALSLLSAPVDGDVGSDEEEFGSKYTDEEYDEEGEGMDESDDEDRTPKVPGKLDRWKSRRTTPGQILVTLFEGEPYTLWNVRDLARHAGLCVVTSFKFPWAAYPGYSHARTLGHIQGRDGGRGGWRGEEREARTYVFEIKGNENSSGQKGRAASGKKRARDDSDSDSS